MKDKENRTVLEAVSVVHDVSFKEDDSFRFVQSALCIVLLCRKNIIHSLFVEGHFVTAFF